MMRNLYSCYYRSLLFIPLQISTLYLLTASLNGLNLFNVIISALLPPFNIIETLILVNLEQKQLSQRK